MKTNFQTQMISAVAAISLGLTCELMAPPCLAQVQNVEHNIVPLSPAQRETQAQSNQSVYAAAVALHAGRYAEAEADAQTVITTTGGFDGVANEVLASALDAQGKTQEALKAYKVMADEGDVFPRNEIPYALLLLKTGQWAQAVAAYNKALPLLSDGELMRESSDFSPTVPQPAELAAALHIALGLTYAYSADWARNSQRANALPEFQKALAREPDSSLANYYYGYGLQKAGRWPEARAAFQKAADLGSGDVKDAAEKALKGQ